MTVTREDRLRIVPSSMRSAYLKSATSRAAAIKAFCNECSGFDRATVKACTAEACPLFAFRPYQSDDGGGDEEETGPEEGAASAPVSPTGKEEPPHGV